MQLHHKKYGAGSPLIILHGLFGSLDNWHTLANRFAEDNEVYAIDQRNHGKSPHAEQHDYPSMAEDLNNFMDENNLNQANIIGHSMGGKTAMFFALYYPEKVKNLVVVDMGPGKYEAGHDEILDALQNFPIEKISSRKEADKILSDMVDNFGIRQFLLKNLDRDGQSGYRWKMNLSVLIRDYENILEEVPQGKVFDNPALFLKGEKSNYIRFSDENEIKKQFPKAALQEIKGAGHWIHAEAPDEFYKSVNEFLISNK